LTARESGWGRKVALTASDLPPEGVPELQTQPKLNTGMELGLKLVKERF
jgi:hypothetical protein